MGLLDFNADDPKNMGLLNLGLSMLSNSGPSPTPRSFGQIFAGGAQAGLGTIQQMKQQKMQEEQAQQMKQLRDLQIQEANQQLQTQRMSLEKQKALEDFYKNRANPMTQMQQALGGNMAPTMQNAARLEQAQQPGTQAPADIYSRRMAESEALRGAGFHTQADAIEQTALKFKPEFDQTPRVGMGADGKPVTYVMDKDGNRKVISGIMPRDEMKLADLGGTSVAYNPYDLKPGQGFTKTMSPDAVASNGLARERLNFDKSQVNKPVFNTEVGGFVTPPSAGSPNGVMTPLAGYTKPDKPLTESQGAALGFGMRAQESQRLLSALEGKGINNGGRVMDTVGSVPLVGGALSSLVNTAPVISPNSKQQEYRQAKSNFISAVLRKESGAVIGDSEFAREDAKYFPQPGDSPSVIQQKSDARDMAIKALEYQSGRTLPTFTPKPHSGGWSIQKAG